MMTKKIIVYDDYNSNIPKNQDVIGTVTTMFGCDSLRHGFKIIEIIDDDNEIQQTKPLAGGDAMQRI